MNIEIANRLVELRKKNNLSQEALAEKLGISRQAVSKWERAEASPDTDNLIMLARIYHVSLDEMLRTEEEISDLQGGACSYEELPPDREEGEEEKYSQKEDPPVVVIEKTGNPVITSWAFFMEGLPLGVIITGTYLVIGALWNLWHPGWLLFILLPVLDSLARSIRKKNAKLFAFPVFVALVYLILGMYMDLWHPGWLIFLTIPIYYPMVNYIQRMIREQDRDLGL